ncbi:PIG-L deacetylase family protein [Engelhardtia mirabilis]|uniref:GlcNAc-PI de-N-acetylase n=1 Tax=Engelhardtia mirabilis TaxID=2528011 RepID=A0A518BKS6_9BACT|nr:GlcNAc-PI de-N-acetylase [Planctomycetes bacterium Pla133]QDV01906.1 GlcNAc-PI de-N-acetylase [Planctomycetes bacterium Pla86]
MASTPSTESGPLGDGFSSFAGSLVHVPDGTSPSEALARTTHLAIVAHPDDLEFLAYHGIAACYGSEDHWFTGVVITDGVGGPSLGQFSAAELRAERQREQRAAADLGRYSAVVMLGASSAQLKQTEPPVELRADLRLLVRACSPRVVYLHNPADRHDTHVACLVHAMQALTELPHHSRPARVLGVEGWRDLDWLTGSDRQELDVSARPHLATALAGAFDSQIAGGKRYDLAVGARRLAHATFGDSHAPDAAAGVTLAMDLTPVLAEGGPSLAQLAARAVEHLGADIAARLERFQEP